MGLKNSAASFQKLMDHVLSGLDGAFAYLDDILLFSKNEREHLTLVEELLARLERNGLSIHLEKCQFAKESIEFLGHHISQHGISPLPKKVQAITAFPAPKTPKDLLGFLGAVNYYRRALPNIGGQQKKYLVESLWTYGESKTWNTIMRQRKTF